MPILTLRDTSVTGNYIISWTHAERANSYMLHEDIDPGFGNPVVAYSGIDTTVRITGKPFGKVFYYRVKASNNDGSSLWSPTKSIILVQGPSPKINVNSAILDFGDVLTGDVSSQTLVASNPGNSVLQITSITVDQAGFQIVSPTSFQIPPSKSANIIVSFSPSKLGPATATITIISNVPDDYPTKITSKGNGVQRAVLQFDQVSVDFGQVVVDSAKLLPLKAKNNGNQDLYVQSGAIVNSSYTLVTNLPAKIKSKDSLNLVIKFLPPKRGSQTGTITIVSTDTLNSTRQISLAGLGIGPSLTLAPTSQLDFGDVPVWSALDRPVRFHNVGERTLTVTTLALSNPSFMAIGAQSIVMAPGTYQDIPFRFSPIRDSTVTATLTIRCNDKEHDPDSMHFFGFGARPRIASTQSALDFGEVDVTTSKTVSLGIQNAGRAPLVLYSTSTDSQYFRSTFVGPMTIPPGGVLPINVSFAPQKLNSNPGRLALRSNDSTNLTSFVQMSGYGDTHVLVSSKADMKTRREEYAADAINGKVYVVGGDFFDGVTHVLSSVEIYDPSNDTWTSGADMPTARYNLQAIAYGGKLYVMGGISSSGNWLTTNEIYDPVNNSWSTGSPLLVSHVRSAIAVANGKIYLFGGAPQGSVTPLSQVDEYDPLSNSWVIKGSLPTARWSMKAEELGGKIYVVGGGDAYSQYAVNEIFDPSTNSWSTTTPMPKSIAAFAMAKVNNRFFVFGGFNANGNGLDILQFDPVLSLWNVKGQLSDTRQFLEAPVVKNQAFIIGGQRSSSGIASDYGLTTNFQALILP